MIKQNHSLLKLQNFFNCYSWTTIKSTLKYTMSTMLSNMICIILLAFNSFVFAVELSQIQGYTSRFVNKGNLIIQYFKEIK